MRFHPEVRELAGALESRVDEAVERIAAMILDMAPYRSGLVAQDELRRSLRLNLDFMIAAMRGQEVDLRPPQEIGRLRAAAGVPLPELLRAYRIGFAELWALLVAEARDAGSHTYDALIDAATQIWALADDYSQAVTEAYRETVAHEAIVDASRRAALIDAVLTGEATDEDTLWEIAGRLRMPYAGVFLVVAAESAELGEDPLDGLANRLAAQDIRSAWRLASGVEAGLISCGSAGRAVTAVDMVSDAASTRVGISPPFERFDGVRDAWRLARHAMSSVPAGAGGARQFVATPIAVMSVSDPAVSRRVARAVLGDVLALPTSDRDVLLDTLEVWLDSRGSATEAGSRMFVHPNTVRHRLRRLEKLSKHDLQDPRHVAELALALQTIRLFPDVGA